MKKPIHLSVVIATHNEEENIGKVLLSVQGIADEILIADGQSSDKTVEIATQYGATVLSMTNKQMFHTNKQEAGNTALGEWILYLDADEIITPELKNEIEKVLNGTHPSQTEQSFLSFVSSKERKLFEVHMAVLEDRDGILFERKQPVHAYFIPRKNFFLGSYLMHSGVYPDGVIRLVRNGKAYWPCKDVHETMKVSGGVSWLTEPMIHLADPSFTRYLQRANRYTSLTAQKLDEQKVSIFLPSYVRYLLWMPTKTFILLFFRHKGILDGFSGFVWSLMSGLHWPMAYLKYLELVKKKSK